VYSQLDDRYLLLGKRAVRWLERAYDGWDRLHARPVTIGYFAPADTPPMLPAAMQLRHPNVHPLLDLRTGGDGSIWAVWEYFGEFGAELFEDTPAPSAVVAWVAHEVTNALLYARGAQSRPGGYRMTDFGPDHIRFGADGQVTIVGYGRLAVDHPEAHEFSSLGDWLGAWLAHSSDAESDPEATGTLSGELISILSAFTEADENPRMAAPRIISALRTAEGTGEALTEWLDSLEHDTTEPELRSRAREALASGKVTIIQTTPLVPDESEAPTSVLPPVTIAPPEPPKIAPRKSGPPKGIPVSRRRQVTTLGAAFAVALLLILAWKYRAVIPLFGSGGRPQVLLETSPAGASVSLDDSLLSGTTPLSLNGVPMGWHHLRFQAAEFPPIEDSILVYKEEAHRPFHFTFTRPIRITSRPPGAAVYENGKRASRNTPFVERDWPVTVPLSLVMHLESYGSIENCVLDPIYGTVEVDDPATWNTERHGDTLVVTGLFVHSVAFLASPADARIVVDDTLNVDASGAQSYPLTFGSHKLRGEALGFDPLDTTIVISGQSQHLLSVALSRPVRIFAVDPNAPETDLRALVDRLDGPERTIFVRRFTPYSIRIPAVAFTASLRKRGYRDTTVYIPPDMTSVTVAMTPQGSKRVEAPPPTSREPSVAEYREEPQEPETEDLTGAPWVDIQITASGLRSLAGADIWARAAGEANERFLGKTDADGSLRAQIPVGNYDLLAYLDAFSGVRKRVKIRPGRNRPLIIELNR